MYQKESNLGQMRNEPQIFSLLLHFSESFLIEEFIRRVRKIEQDVFDEEEIKEVKDLKNKRECLKQ